MKHMGAALESLDEPFSIHSPDYIVQYANDAALSMAGLKREEVIGRKCYEVFHGLKGPPPNCPLRPAYESGRTKTVEMGPPYLSGEYIVTAHPIPSANGKTIETLHFLRNITEIKKKVMDENRKLSLFTEIVTHDMNNYIHGSLLAFDLYENSPDSASREKYFYMARGQIIQSKIFLDNVKKLLWFDEREWLSSKGRVGPVIEEAISILEQSGGRKEFNVTVASEVDAVNIIANDFLVDVFLNIFSNSVRRSSPMPAEIYITGKDCEDDPSFYRFEISDRSGLIPEEYKKAVFERVTEGDLSVMWGGVGLMLAKIIVENYGGRIWVEDFTDKDGARGATFIFLLKKG